MTEKIYVQGTLRKLCGIGFVDKELGRYAIRSDGLWFKPPAGFDSLTIEEQEALSGFQELEPMDTEDGLLLGRSTIAGVKPLLAFPFTADELRAFNYFSGDEISARLVMGCDFEQWLQEQPLNVQELAQALLLDELPPLDAKKSPRHCETTVESFSAVNRRAARWQMCLEAGLTMPLDTYKPFPRGIQSIAKSLGISRQALSEDLNKHRECMARK